MGASASSDDDFISAINVTPLVDVMLVLLVIFMITAPVLYQSAIKVKLPTASTGEEAAKNPLDFSVTQEGKVFWGEDAITWEDLEARLKSMGDQTKNETATISADKATPHGTVVKLMDLLRKTGLTRFALNVETAPDK